MVLFQAILSVLSRLLRIAETIVVARSLKERMRETGQATAYEKLRRALSARRRQRAVDAAGGRMREDPYQRNE